MGKSQSEVNAMAEFDRAVSAVGTAIGRLTRLLDGDPEVADRAMLALAEIGPYSAEPMAAVLRRSRSFRQKVLIIRLLVLLGPEVRLIAGGALVDLLKRDKDPFLLQVAVAAQTELIMRGLEESADDRPRP